MSRDALRHDNIEPTLSVTKSPVATPTSNPNQAKRSIETPYDMILTNRHRASRRREKVPYIAYMSLVKAQDKTLSNRRRASQRLLSRRRLKIQYETYMSRRRPQHKTLAKQRRASQRPSSRLRLEMPSAANMSLGSTKTRRWQTDAESGDAYQRYADSRFHLFHWLSHKP
jgi:hypothetical protein